MYAVHVRPCKHRFRVFCCCELYFMACIIYVCFMCFLFGVAEYDDDDDDKEDYKEDNGSRIKVF